jgi:hypothetical protein
MGPDHPTHPEGLPAMPASLTCPEGHAVPLFAVATLAPGDPLACPVCGAAVSLAPRADGGSESATLPPASVEAPTLPPSPEAAALAPNSAALVSERAAVPGYEVLGELGRGGMGVVYKARHVGLNRLVALKMVLAGGHAGPEELARFRGEAEAVARLKHPNVVQVYDVGESGGLPYFSLEFVEGGSLDRKLAGTPLPPNEAAALVETLARAMAAAHAAGLVHRDLKPANILLAPDGTPKVTDFGLAKKLDSAGPTASGAVMGTPSYMAPEQAGGKSKEIGPLVDVYALGAILYECLTGRPPFKAATPLDTILQVMSDEPVPPRRLNAGVPVDLETICLKCLHKEPPRRYESSAALADDLRRFAEGRPIVARPVGRVERAAKWVRRNPVVALLTATAALSLLVGAAVSVYFAVDAAAQARQAKQNEADAKQSEAEAKRARKDLAESNDRLLTSAARSLLRPLALQAATNQPGPLAAPEVESLWELAATPEEELRLRFIEEALRSPATTRQLKERRAYALQAAVGLDEARRGRVERLLGDLLGAEGVPAEQRVDLARILAEVGIRDAGVAERAAPALIEAMREAPNAEQAQSLAQDLSAVSSCLGAKEAAAAYGRGAVAISEGMSKTTQANNLKHLMTCLAALSPRLEAKEAAEVAATLARAMTRTNDFYALEPLAQALSAVSPRLATEDAAGVAATLTRALDAATSRPALPWLATALAALAPRLGEKEAGEAADSVSRAAGRTTDAYALQSLADSLAVLSSRLEAKRAAVVGGRAASQLAQVMTQETNSQALEMMAAGTAALAPRLEASDAGGAAAAVVQAMRRTKDLYTLLGLATRLAALSSRLEGKERAKLCGEGVAVLTEEMGKTEDPSLLHSLAGGVAALAPGLEAREVGEVTLTLTRAMGKTSDPRAAQALSAALPALLSRLGTKEAGQTAAVVVAAMDRPGNRETLEPLARGLSALAPRLDPGAAGEAASPLVKSMSRARDPYSLRWLAAGLAAVSSRLAEKDAAAACGQAALLLAQAMSRTTDPFQSQWLADSLSAVSPRLEPPEAEKAADLLTQAISKRTDPYVLGPLAEGLSALSSRLEATRAAAVCAGAAATLPQAMGRTANPHELASLAKGLAALSGRLGEKEAAEACGRGAALLARAVGQVTNPDDLKELAASLSALAPRLEAKEAGEVAAVVRQATSRQVNSNTYQHLGILDGLSAVSPSLSAGEAAAAVELLLWATARSPDREGPFLAETLTAVASRLSPADRRQRVAAVVASLGPPPHGLLPPAPVPLLRQGPVSCVLTTPQLVELLKHPLCVGEARRALLDQLGNRYGRRFADQWEFVRFANERDLGLDFNSPPQRPHATTATKP